MALRAMYKGFKKVLAPLIINRPGELAIDQDVLNTELNTVFFPRSEQAVSGQMNFSRLKPTTTNAGNLDFTANADGTFHVEGTANATDNIFRTTYKMNKGTYYLSGVTGGKSGDTFLYELHLKIGTTDIRNYDGFTEFTISNDDTEVLEEFIYRNGAVIDTTVKPMISLASDIPYAPPAMTNKQLTDEITSKIVFEEGTSLLTPGENITLGAVMKNRVGNLVTYSFVMTTTDAITANSRLLSGMDAPAPLNDGIYSGTIYADGTLYKVIFSISSSVAYLITQDAIPSGKSLRGTITYITKASAANRSLPEATREAAPEDVTPEEEPVVKKTTRKKSTAKADAEKEGE